MKPNTLYYVRNNPYSEYSHDKDIYWVNYENAAIDDGSIPINSIVLYLKDSFFEEWTDRVVLYGNKIICLPDFKKNSDPTLEFEEVKYIKKINK